MKKIIVTIIIPFILTAFALSACTTRQPAVQSTSAHSIKVLAANSFLADMAQNVCGSRQIVASLIPVGMDPHTFEATPKDVAKIAESQVLIINGGGLEEWLAETIENAGGERLMIEASAGLTMRQPSEAEASHEHEHEQESHENKDIEHEAEEHHDEDGEHHHEGDPHFWLDPNLVIKYVENIRDGLIKADPSGKEIYVQNAEAYTKQLQELDAWISRQVAQIPQEKRMLVTDHHALGYFADRYGFDVIGAIIPSVSTGSSPSAQELAQLMQQIQTNNAPAVFLNVGANTKLAEQISSEVGVKVITDLYIRSVSEADGAAPTYIEMMRYNTDKIVAALK